MNEFMQSITGMDGMSDQIIAGDLLFATKAGIKSITVALTESANTETKQILRSQLDDTVDLHQRVSTYMVKKGYYHPGDVAEQLKVDITLANTVLDKNK
jgi:similar to spore coat protein